LRARPKLARARPKLARASDAPTIWRFYAVGGFMRDWRFGGFMCFWAVKTH